MCVQVVSKFQELNSGAPASEVWMRQFETCSFPLTLRLQESELDRLWKRNEDQRREIEGLRRQLAEEVFPHSHDSIRSAP